jgi:hypothetical protein
VDNILHQYIIGWRDRQEDRGHVHLLAETDTSKEKGTNRKDSEQEQKTRRKVIVLRRILKQR